MISEATAKQLIFVRALGAKQPILFARSINDKFSCGFLEDLESWLEFDDLMDVVSISKHWNQFIEQPKPD